MVDQNAVFLGLEFLLGALLVGGAVVVVPRFFPRVSERSVEIVVGALLGVFLILKGLYGLPAAAAIKARLIDLIPYTAVAAWILLACRFWWWAMGHQRELLRRINDATEGLSRPADLTPDRLQAIENSIAVAARNASEKIEGVRKELVALIMEPRGARPTLAIQKSPRMLDRAGWDYWLKFDSIELWQAIAVSLGFDPRSIGDYGLGVPEIDDRLRLAESHMTTGFKVNRHNMIGSRYPTSDVPLSAIIHWVLQTKLDTPDEVKIWFLDRKR